MLKTVAVRLAQMLLVAVLLTRSASLAAATTFYVSAANGNDNWSGTLAAPNSTNTDGPFQTLLRGKTAMENSATIKTVTLRAGTYSVAANFSFNWQDSGETWIPYQGELAVIDGAGVGHIASVGATALTIEGLVFQNLTDGGLTLDNHGHTIRWNTFRNCETQCLSGGGMTDSVIDSNTFERQFPGNPAGNVATAYTAIVLWWGASNNRVTHNSFHDCEGGGVAFADGPNDPPMNNNIIDRNLLRNMGTNCFDIGALYIYDASSQSVGNQFTNNVVDGFGGYTTSTTTSTDNWTKAMYLDDGTSNVLVSGNVFRGCGEYGLQFHGGKNNTIVNNIFDLSAGGSQLAFYQQSVQIADNGMPGNTFKNNIVYSSSAFPASLWRIIISPYDALPINSANLYYSASGAAIPNSDSVDARPTFANPQFSNAAAADYSIPASSPAYSSIAWQTLPTDQGPLPSPFVVPITINLATPATLTAAAGSTISFTTHWSGQATLNSEMIFTHFVGSAGNVSFADPDHFPILDTTQWTGGPYSELRTVTIPATASGTYAIMAGLFSGAQRFTLNPGAGVIADNQTRYQIGTLTIVAANQPPVLLSAATASPTAASLNQAVQFSVAASDPENDPLTYAWNFGDGASSSGATPVHAYAAAGTYIAVVSVSDGHNPPVTSSVTVVVTAAVSPLHIAIDSGGPAAGSFAADTAVNGGWTYSTTSKIRTTGLTNPAPQAVYRTERYGNFTYTIGNLTPGAAYTVRLHFAEIYWDGPGQRAFNVTLNGQQVLANFDVFAAAGGKFIAIIKEFNAVAVNGQIVIAYSTLKDNAKSSGIEILSAAAPAILAAASTAAQPEADAATAASASIDLGSVKLGQTLKLKLDAPESGLAVRQLRWSAVAPKSLPKGITVSAGTLHGRPTVAGTYTFQLQVKCKGGAGINNYSLTVAP